MDKLLDQLLIRDGFDLADPLFQDDEIKAYRNMCKNLFSTDSDAQSKALEEANKFLEETKIINLSTVSKRNKTELPEKPSCSFIADNPNYNCVICMEFLQSPVSLSCGHTYCQWCYQTQLNNNCAICRKSFFGDISVNILLRDNLEEATGKCEYCVWTGLKKEYSEHLKACELVRELMEEIN